MIRLAAAAFLPFTVGAAAPQPPDVISAGKVLATLDDWRAIMFGQMVLIALLLFALLSVFALMIRTISRQATANAETASALRELSDAYKGSMATIARIEARLSLP